jgi:pSer/pThr/pTyr-binding forkhead associated (FHA) protein
VTNVCQNCGKENQSHYRFCAGCGAEITAAATPSGAGEIDAMEWPGTGELRVLDLQGGSDSSLRLCPSCGSTVPAEFGFCGECGTRVPPGQAVVSAASGVTSARLILLRPDGSESGSHPLQEGENILGRASGPTFAADGYLSPRHALIVVNAAGVVVRDLGSLNGTFLRIVGEERIEDGDVFRIGQELLRFEAMHAPEPLDDGTQVMGSPNPGYWGRVSIVVGQNQEGSAFPIGGDGVQLGRERGDIIFPEDGYVSGAHAQVTMRGDYHFLTDLNSSNGTFLRLRHDRLLMSGSLLLLGQQLFRLMY